MISLCASMSYFMGLVGYFKCYFRLNTENISESGMNNLLTYSFGYYPLEQKMLWDKFLNWSDRKKKSNQVILVLNTTA